MRSLARGGFTQSEVENALFAENAAIGCQFDVVDRDGGIIDRLPVGDAGVQIDGATADFNVDAEIKGQLSLRMRPHEALRGKPFTRLIRASFTVKIGSTEVSFPVGEFVWSSPNRDVWPGDEWWNVRLGDKSHLLDLGGPGAAGFNAGKGALLSSEANRALRAAGFPENFPTLDERLPKTYIFGLTTPRLITVLDDRLQREMAAARVAKGQRPTAANVAAARRARILATQRSRYVVENAPTTWLSVINTLCQSVGHTFFFDYDGDPRIVPYRDLANATPDFTFGVGHLAARVSTSTEYEKIANRVFVRPRSDSKLSVTTVDANTVMPWHPLAESKVGVYVDATIDDDTATSAAAQKAIGLKRLFEGTGAYERVNAEVLVHPGVELFDVVGLEIDDPEFADGAVLHTRNFSFGLGDGLMPLECSRVFTS